MDSSLEANDGSVELTSPQSLALIKHTSSAINSQTILPRGGQLPTNFDKLVHNAPKGLRTFPPEIREMIFQYTLAWKGKTPALLKALRGDPELYGEALRVFYFRNSFHLSRRNYFLRHVPLSPEYLTVSKTVLSLTLEYTFKGYYHRSPERLIASRCCLASGEVIRRVSNYSNIRCLHIDFCAAWSLICPYVGAVWPFPPSQQPDDLSQLYLLVGNCTVRNNPTQFQQFIERMNEGLGVNGVLAVVTTEGPMYWLWEAKGNTVLKWKEGVAWTQGMSASLIGLDAAANGPNMEHMFDYDSVWPAIVFPLSEKDFADMVAARAVNV